MEENISQVLSLGSAIPVLVTALVLGYQRLKQVGHSSQSIKMSKIELFLKVLKESPTDRLSIELMFQSLFKKAIPYKEISFLFTLNSPLLAIQDYISSHDFVDIENELFVFKDNYTIKKLGWYSLIYELLFYSFSFLGIILITIFIFLFIKHLEVNVSLAVEGLMLLFTSIIFLFRKRDINAALRITKEHTNH